MKREEGQRQCGYCGQAFWPVRWWQRYDSHRCRTAAYRLRLTAEERIRGAKQPIWLRTAEQATSEARAH